MSDPIGEPRVPVPAMAMILAEPDRGRVAICAYETRGSADIGGECRLEPALDSGGRRR